MLRYVTSYYSLFNLEEYVITGSKSSYKFSSVSGGADALADRTDTDDREVD